MRRSSQITPSAPALLDVESLLSFWNHAQPDDLSASARLLAWWQGGTAALGLPAAALLLHRAETLAGALLLSAAPPDAPAPRAAWVDGLAVGPSRTRAADLRHLLESAQEWARTQGCAALTLGGGPFGLLRGLSGPLAGPRLAATLARAGFEPASAVSVFDMVADVARYRPPSDLPPVAGVVRPAQPRDRDDIETLLAGPLLDAATGDAVSAPALLTLRHLLLVGRLSDLMLLWTDDGVVGLAQLAFADSLWPVDAAYPWALARPWAALPVLLARPAWADAGLPALMDAALRRLHNTGVNSCLVPGILRTAPFERAGFRRGRAWGTATNKV